MITPWSRIRSDIHLSSFRYPLLDAKQAKSMVNIDGWPFNKTNRAFKSCDTSNMRAKRALCSKSDAFLYHSPMEFIIIVLMRLVKALWFHEYCKITAEFGWLPRNTRINVDINSCFILFHTFLMKIFDSVTKAQRKSFQPNNLDWLTKDPQKKT